MKAAPTVSEYRRFWTLLPPLELRGIGTPLVEDVDHYISRMLAASGITMRQMCKLLLSTRLNSSQTQLMLIAVPSSRSGAAIARLAEMTGNEHLRCGSFSNVAAVLNISATGRTQRKRRWCPVCYAEWDGDLSWEPLAWRIAIQLRCPRHGCPLEDTCRHCGCWQGNPATYRTRRNCRRCRESLGGNPAATQFPDSVAFAEACCADLISLCADPEQQAIPISAYDQFLASLRESFDVERLSKSSLALSLDMSQQKHILFRHTRAYRTSIRRIVELCALQGILPRDLLLRPVEAGGGTLANWRGDAVAVPLPFGEFAEKVGPFARIAKKLLAHAATDYLPALRVLLKAAKLPRNIAVEMDPGEYARYQLAYEKQGSSEQRVHGDRASRCALAAIKAGVYPGPKKERWIRSMAGYVAKEANVTTIVARRAIRGANRLHYATSRRSSRRRP